MAERVGRTACADRHRPGQPRLPAAARPPGHGARQCVARGRATASSSRCSGPSGCGKSTLLYLVGGFLPVEHGAIRVEDRPIAGPGPDRGIVFQHFALFPWKTVIQNVLYGLEKQGMARDERLRRAREFIDLVGLAGFEDSYPSQLSAA